MLISEDLTCLIEQNQESRMGAWEAGETWELSSSGEG